MRFSAGLDPGQNAGKSPHRQPVIGLRFVELHELAAAVGRHLVGRLKPLAPQAIAAENNTRQEPPLAQDSLDVSFHPRRGGLQRFAVAGQTEVLDKGEHDRRDPWRECRPCFPLHPAGPRHA